MGYSKEYRNGVSPEMGQVRLTSLSKATSQWFLIAGISHGMRCAAVLEEPEELPVNPWMAFPDLSSPATLFPASALFWHWARC